MNSDDLRQHRLFSYILEPVAGLVQKHGPEKINSEDFLPDELEYYILNAGYWISHLTTLCEQLEDAEHLLGNYDYKNSKSANRFKHFRYNLENYMIRAVSISDRALQLTNAIFHLGNSPAQINRHIITKNMKVARTKVGVVFNKYDSLLCDKKPIRNEIVHRNTILDRQLRHLELFYLDGIGDNPPANFSKREFSRYRATRLREKIQVSKKEIAELNSALIENTVSLFDELIPIYQQNLARINAYLKDQIS